MKKKISIGYIVAVVLLILFSLGPIIWCFIISLTPEAEMLKQTNSIMPSELIWDRYIQILDTSTQAHKTIVSGLEGSIKISAITLGLGIPLTTITAYALSRYEFRGKKVLVNLLLLTIVIPVFSTIIPIYNIFKDLNLLDSMTMTAVIYISSFMPMNTWIMMNYFNQIPEEIWQAASLDGFTKVQTFFKIAIPMASPAILTCSLIMFLMSWKQYVIPTILLTSFDNRTITMVMSEFMTRDAIEYGMISAAGILAIIPPTIAAVLFRKFLVSNMSSGAMK